MQKPVKPNKEKRNHEYNVHEIEDKKKKSNNNAKLRKSNSRSQKEHNRILKKSDGNKGELEQIMRVIPDSNLSNLEIVKRKKNQIIRKNINYFKETSNNIIGYLAAFLAISDCFNFINTDRRNRNLIMTKHKYFPLFIKLREKQSLTVENLFERTSYKDPNCTELDLFKSNVIKDQLNEEETEILFQEFLVSITKRKELSICDSSVNLKYLKMLLCHPNCPVSNFNCNVPNQNICSEICDIIAKSKSIQSLDFSDLKFNFENVQKLVLPLANNKIIKRINLSAGNNPTIARYNDSCSIFLNIFNTNTSVEELTMTNLKINQKLGLVLSDFIKENKTIKSLKFKQCKINDTTNRIFYDSFRDNITLESLSFESTPFNISSLKNLVKDLTFESKTNQIQTDLTLASKLKHVSFANCNLGEKQIEMVTKIVEKNSNIVSFDLSSNKVSCSSFPCIISMIKNKTNLKKLNLSWAEISNIEFEAISDALLLNNTLESIDLSYNKFSCKINEIIDIFKVNLILKEFVTIGNNVII